MISASYIEHDFFEDDLGLSKSKKTPFLSVEKKVFDTPNTGKSSPSTQKRTSKDLAKMLLDGGENEVNSGKNSRAHSESSKRNSPVKEKESPVKERNSTPKEEKKSTPPKNKKKSATEATETSIPANLSNLDSFLFKSNKPATNISNQKGFKKRKPNSFPAKENKSPPKIIEPEVLSRKNSMHNSSGENSVKSISVANLLETFSKDKASKGKSSDSENSRDIREIKMVSSKKSSQSSDDKKKKKNKKPFKSPEFGEISQNAKPIIQESAHVPRLIEFTDDFKENSNKSVSTSIPGGRKYKTINNNFLISQQSIPPANVDNEKLFSSVSAPVTQKNKGSSQKSEAGENKQTEKVSTGNKSGNSVLDKSPKLAEFFKPHKKESESKGDVVRATKLTRNERNALPGFECGQCKKVAYSESFLLISVV